MFVEPLGGVVLLRDAGGYHVFAWHFGAIYAVEEGVVGVVRVASGEGFHEGDWGQVFFDFVV